MGYIGAEPATSFEAVQKDRFTSTTGTTVTLSHTVSTVQDIVVWVNSVKQDYTNYSVNGTTLTLGGSLVSADIVEVVYVGRTLQTVAPATNMVTNAMMADDSINSAEIADGSIDTAHIADDQVTYAKIQNVSATDKILGRDSSGAGVIEEISPANLRTMINVADGANAYTHPNHSGEVTSTADGATVIADNIVDEANLKVSNSPTNGYMLTAQSGNTGGLTWATAPSSEWTKIANINTASGTSMGFDDCFSDTYNTYLITFQFENDRNGNQIWMRFQADDDSTFNSNYRYACHQTNDGGTESTRVATGDSKWLMTGGTAGGNTSVFGGCFGHMYVHNPYDPPTGRHGAGSKYRCAWHAHYNEYDDSGHVVNSVATGMLEQNDYNVAGIRFLPSANYLGKRNATVWGLKEY